MHCIRLPHSRGFLRIVLPVAVASFWVLNAAPRFHSDRLPYADRSIRVGFWFGMSNNEVLTPQLIDWVGERASIVILNATEKGMDPHFDYERVVARFQRRFPDLPVLLYDWLQQDHRTGVGGRVGGLSYDVLLKKTDWQLKRLDGKTNRKRVLLMDVTNPDYRAYLIQHVTANVKRFGTQGVAFDTTFATLTRPGIDPAMRYVNGEKLAAAWTEATQTLLKEIGSALGDKRLVLFNGLFHNSYAGRMAAQETLVPFVDAVAVEFFGRNVHVREGKRNEKADFKEFVWDYVEAMSRHPDKIIPVFGRSPRYVYLDYEEDYRIQRYCLSGFLLAMTPLSTFKYHSHFQTGYTPPGRTYGLSYYADYDLDVGVPISVAQKVGGAYVRPYTKALIAVAPMHGEVVAVKLDRPCWTPEGAPVAGTVQVEPGTGGVFLFEKPSVPPPFKQDFEDEVVGMWRQPVRDGGVAIAQHPDGTKFLRIRSSTDPLYEYHETRIESIRSLRRHDELKFRIRTNDIAGAMLVRVEVNDSRPAALVWTENFNDFGSRWSARGEKRAPYAVLVIRPDEGTFSFAALDRDIPYGQRRAGRAPYVAVSGSRYSADGQWHDITVPLSAVFAESAPHLAPRRIAEMRLVGEADIDDIQLGKPVALNIDHGMGGGIAVAQSPIDHVPEGILFREDFSAVEPMGNFPRGKGTVLKGANQPRWRVRLGANELTEFGLREIDGRPRGLCLVPEGESGGTHDLLVSCPIAPEKRPCGSRALTIALTYTPLAVHGGGPNPWNKLWYVGVRSSSTGLGYNVGMDIQTNERSPENKFLRLEVFGQKSTPTADNMATPHPGLWVGPRLRSDDVPKTYDITVTFTPDATGKGTTVAWTLAERNTGRTESGRESLPYRLSADARLDIIRIVPNRWAHGILHRLEVRTPPKPGR